MRLAHLKKLAQLPVLSDPEMVNQLVTHQTRAAAPVPSVEAILHAILPYPYVDHTHADAVVTICNTPDGLRRIEELYGDVAVIVPYVMPGAGGKNISLPLAWTDTPAGTKSFALSIVDPHPVARNWVHWLVINLPAGAASLPRSLAAASFRTWNWSPKIP